MAFTVYCLAKKACVMVSCLTRLSSESSVLAIQVPPFN